MIKNFEDKDGQIFDLQLRSRYSSIKNARQLIKILDDSINAKPESIKKSYQNHTYMYIMRDFGMITQSKRIIK